MRSRRIVIPLVVNAVLLAVLVVVRLPGVAHAQNAGNRPRGEYAMLAGRLGEGGSVIYVTDSASGEMVALKWDSSRRTLSGLGYRPVGNDANQQMGR